MATLKEIMIDLIVSGRFESDYSRLNPDTVVFVQDSDGAIYGFNTANIVYRPEHEGNEWYYADPDDGSNDITHSFHEDMELSSDYKIAMIPAQDLRKYFLKTTQFRS